MSVDQALIRSPILNAWGESAIYIPGSGDERAINVVIDRDRGNEETIGPGPGGFRQSIRVHVANDATTGISASELDLGADCIRLAPHPGRSEQIFKIVDIIDSDEAFLLLEIA